MTKPKLLPILLSFALASMLAPAASDAATAGSDDPTLEDADPNAPLADRPSPEFYALIGADSLAATTAAATILVEQLAAYHAAGGSVDKLRAKQPALAKILALALGEARGPSKGPVTPVLASMLRRRVHAKEHIDENIDVELTTLLPSGPDRSSASALWETYIEVTLKAGGAAEVEASCIDPLCRRFEATLVDPDGTKATFRGSGPIFFRDDVSAIILDDDGGFDPNSAADIASRMRKRPDPLTAEWDQLIDEQLTLLQE